MDELLFRSSQKLESLQYQLGIAATEGKRAVLEYSTQTKNIFINYLNSPNYAQLQENFRNLWFYIVDVADHVRYTILFHINPRRIFHSLQRVFGTHWTKRDLYFGCAGLILGGVIGVGIGISLQNQNVYKYMHAIQCTSYMGIDGANYMEDVVMKSSCDSDEVLVTVKAGSVQILDAEICKGYGRTLRSLLSKYYQYSKQDLPVTLGRDCTGIVTDIGPNVTKFDVGDEVWLTVPFWAPGTLSQYVYAREHQVACKPKSIGFEAACSLPYSGSVALAALEQANLFSANNSKGKSVFVQGGCTPVGCVLIQILKSWGAKVTTTCFKRAVPVAQAMGADEIIVLLESEIKTKTAVNIQLPEIAMNALIKELELREKFDVIINTRNCGPINFKEFCDCYVSTLNEDLPSDDYGFIMRSIFGLFVRIKCLLQRCRGCEIYDFGETHMCHESLNQLHDLVEDGQIKPLVDKVLHPLEIDKALYHIQSTESIGSTIITFR